MLQSSCLLPSVRPLSTRSPRRCLWKHHVHGVRTLSRKTPIRVATTIPVFMSLITVDLGQWGEGGGGGVRTSCLLLPVTPLTTRPPRRCLWKHHVHGVRTLSRKAPITRPGVRRRGERAGFDLHVFCSQLDLDHSATEAVAVETLCARSNDPVT